MNAFSGFVEQHNHSHPYVTVDNKSQVSNKWVYTEEVNCEFNYVHSIDDDPRQYFVGKSQHDSFN